MAKKPMVKNYKCEKCGNTSYIQKQVHMTGGMFSKMFDVQNRKFFATVCGNDECGYTEFYARKSGLLGNIVDFFVDG